MGWFTSKKEKEEKAKKKKEEEEAKLKAEEEEKEAAEKKKREEEAEKAKEKKPDGAEEGKESEAADKAADGEAAAAAAAASTATLPPAPTEGAAPASVPPSTAASPTSGPAAAPGAAVPPVDGAANPSLSGSVDPNAARPEPSPAPMRPKVIVGPPPGVVYPHQHHHHHHGHHHHHHQHAHAYPPHQHHLRQVSSSSNGGLAAPPAGRVPPTRPPPKVVVPPTPGSHQSIPTPRGSEAGDVPPTVYRPPVVVQGGPPPQHHHHHHHQHAHAYQHPPPGAYGAAPVVVVPSRGPSAQGSPASATDAQPQGTAYPPQSPSASSVPASPAEGAGSSGAVPGSPAADSQPPSTPPAATPKEEVPAAAAAAPSTPPPPADGSESDSADFVEEDDDDNTAPPDPAQVPAAAAAATPPASVPVSRQTSAATSAAAAADNASVAGTEATVTAASTTGSAAKPQAPSPKRAASKSAARAPSKPQPRSPIRKTPTTSTAAPKREKIAAINTSADTVIERQPDSEPELPSPIDPAVDMAQLSRSDANHVKGWVRDRFARLVCPQQYYGQIQRVHHVRPFTSKPRQIPGSRAFAVYAIRDQSELERLTRAGGVFRGVANDGSHRFATQVQLDPRSSRRAAPLAVGGPPCRLTTFALCDIPTRRIRFAETAGEAIGSLEEAATAFVTESSAYVVSDLADVRVHALLDVTWSLFSDDTPPVCPQHKVALQLFEPESRQLLCALCTANDMQRGECIVLNDMFSGASLRSIQHSLTERLEDVAHRVSSHVTAHRAAAASSDRRRHAVELQFSLVQAALDAKKAELNAILDEEDRDRDLAASRGIMSETEVRRHLAAALTHVREIGALKETAALAQAEDDAVEPTPPLAQMATVVSSLGHIEHSNEPVPIEASRFSADLDSRLRVNLEHVIRTITDVSFITPAPGDSASPGRGRRLSPTRALATSPPPPQHHHSEPVEQISPQVQNRLRRHQQQAPSARQRARSAVERSRATRATSPPRATPIAPALNSPTRGGLGPNTSATLTKSKNDKRRREHVRNGNRSPVRRQAEPAPSSIAMLMPPPREHHSHHFEPTTAPNGSVLYDIRVDGLATASTVVEWKVRIDDPGSWVGLGVAVGDSFDSLTNSRTNDTRHLWIAPPTVPRHVRLRVSVGPHRHCKLTVHDTLGRQLDDNRIPHWAPGRLAYPQVSFGDVPGTVTLVEPPRQFPLPGARS